MKPFRFHPVVQADVNAALRHYRRESDALAQAFWEDPKLHLDHVK